MRGIPGCQEEQACGARALVLDFGKVGSVDTSGVLVIKRVDKQLAESPLRTSPRSAGTTTRW